MTAVEFLDLLLLHTVATHGLITGVAHVHFVSNEDSRAATLIVDEWRLVGRQLVHPIHLHLIFRRVQFINI